MLKWIRTLAKRATKYLVGHPRDPGLVRWFAGSTTAAGVEVDEVSALSYSAVWAGVRTLSDAVGSMPIRVYRGRDEDPGHNVARLLAREPNEEMTPFAFWSCLTTHLSLWGQAFAEIEYDNAGRPRALWPIYPDYVRPKRTEAGKLYYRVQAPGHDAECLPAYAVYHVPLLTLDGVDGVGVVSTARESLGIGVAAEAFGAEYFGNGAAPAGVLEHPGELGEAAARNLRESWSETHQGLGKRHRVAVLEEGMKYSRISHTPEEAQFLETRGFQVVEVARWLNLPPHFLRDLSKANYSNLEHQGGEFLTYSLAPILTRFEQEAGRKLFKPSEREVGYRAAFDFAALLRADITTRYAAYSTGRQGGWLSVNDIRRAEGLPPIAGGDEYLSPVNMTPVGPGGAAQE